MLAMVRLLLRILVLALIGWLAWLMFRPRYAVKIVMDSHGVKSHHGLPAAKVTEIVRFLEQEVGIEGRATILGERDRTGVVRVRFRGRLHPGMQQKIRNFLALHL
jgi:hypothetical protein